MATDVRSLLRPITGGGGAPSQMLNVSFAIAIVFLLGVGMATMAMGEIQADQVGVLVNNLTGSFTEVHPGTTFYNSIISDLYVIDRSRQTIMMQDRQEGRKRSRGDRSDGGDVKIKTFDGSDVNADIIVTYTVEPAKVIEILQSSGPEDAYKEKWVRDYARSVTRAVLGELTTEEFYDSTKRDEKATRAEEIINEKLARWGLRVTNVQVQSFRFYKEYEEKIRAKKLADQEVEEQKSKAKAAHEVKERKRIEEDKKMEAAVARFEGEMEKLILAARAEADKTRQEASAYAYTTTVAADAYFYEAQQKSEAILAQRKAEAEALKEMVSALEGGRALVKMEYARKLKDLRLSGTPVVYEERVDLLEHSMERGGAAPIISLPAGGSPREGGEVR